MLKKWGFRILKGFFYTALTVIVLVFSAVSVAWFKPEWILTPSRVSSLAKFFLVPPKDSSPIPLTLEIGKPNWKTRQLRVGLAVGCYQVLPAIHPSIHFCLDRGALSLTVRLNRKSYLQLQSLDNLDFLFTRIEIKSGPKSEETVAEEPISTGPPTWMKYISNGFQWGNIALDVRELHVGEGELIIRGNFSSEPFAKPSSAVKDTARVADPNDFLNSPLLNFKASVESPSFVVKAAGKVEHDHDQILVPSAQADYKARGGANPMHITAGVNAKYDLSTSNIDVNFDAQWKNPVEEIRSIHAKKGTFRMSETEMGAKASIDVLLKGKTPVGTPPLLSLELGVSTKEDTSVEIAPVDITVNIDSYEFAGMKATSDLAVRMTTYPSRSEFEIKKGELKIEVKEFGDTAKILERTSWAIPAPFAVLRGPLVFRSAPIRSTETHVELPFTLTSNLHSPEQAVRTDTNILVTLSAKSLNPEKITIAVGLKEIRLRVPDYDPIAPVPAYARDSRIIREKPPTRKQAKTTAAVSDEKPPFPIELTIDAQPNSIFLMNRFFSPAFAAQAQLKMELQADSGSPTGNVTLSTPFFIEYLNRKIRVENMRLGLEPLVNFSAFVSMDRAGYKITAKITQSRGKTQIKLGSVPPLEDNEIVSLLIYGMPKNSISTEQTRSVGSAQSAIESDALGVFSFWAFASTPIESVLYDPATQTYSAVIRLPGGIVASIGSSWDNDRQVSLSKSLGRHWAVSTELVKDSEGIERGGTLLRWRKSY